MRVGPLPHQLFVEAPRLRRRPSRPMWIDPRGSLRGADDPRPERLSSRWSAVGAAVDAMLGTGVVRVRPALPKRRPANGCFPFAEVVDEGAAALAMGRVGVSTPASAMGIGRTTAAPPAGAVARSSRAAGAGFVAAAAAAQAGVAGAEVGVGLAVAPEEVERRFYDAHSHSFVISPSPGKYSGAVLPFLAAQQGVLTTALASLQEAGVARMVVSGKVDPTDPVLRRAWNSWDLNQVVQAMHAQDEGFFVPIANLTMDLSEDGLGSEQRWDDREVLEDFLARGFHGIGEILVHGHGVDMEGSSGLSNLLYVCQLAGTVGVPVMFHWDLLSVEGAATVTPQESRDELRALLGILDLAGVSTTIVIAHCGGGPDGGTKAPGNADFDDYLVLMDELLARDDVFFDLGGMQVGQGGVNPVRNLVNGRVVTHLGEAILGWIAEHPTKFMFGLDADPQGIAHGGLQEMEDYRQSVGWYHQFLIRGAQDSTTGAYIVPPIEPVIRHRVLYVNAWELYR